MISADTKDALAREVPSAPHCREALLAGLALYGNVCGEFVTHRNAVARLFWSLLDERKSHPIETRLPTRLHRLPTFAIAIPERLLHVPPKPIHKCDRLIEVRAAFLACGSLAAGAHGYHLEFVARDETVASRLSWMMRSAGVPAKAARRKGRFVLYYKDFDAIAELLTHLGAYGAVLVLEDVRALRETKNRIHRLVNTEAANLERSAQAAAAQRQVIEYVRSAYGLNRLTPALREVAELRLKHPDESLTELGRRCAPPISKPTVSGRLGALSRLAEHLRAGQVSAKAIR
ncbi:MAG: DNA-binding protein WhiA [Candidatus Eremiobacteraeota bacterium]|nr:DNA-binding protein WhiA [Candidatus Eremiobacteraeota bacterium]